MYSMLFYTILVILIFALVIRFMTPILLVLFVAYIIYYIYRLYKYRQFMKTVDKAEKAFKEEWDNVTSSNEYQTRSRPSSTASDVIEADYTVKDEKKNQY